MGYCQILWGTIASLNKGRLKFYLAFCLQNVQSFWDFCRQIMPSYFCTIPKGRLKIYVAFCLQNVQSFWDFCRQIMPSYFCTIPKGENPLYPQKESKAPLVIVKLFDTCGSA